GLVRTIGRSMLKSRPARPRASTIDLERAACCHARRGNYTPRLWVRSVAIGAAGAAEDAQRPRSRRPVRNGTVGWRRIRYAAYMSERNGDRARFQKDRKRKLRHRRRIRAFAAKLRLRKR